MKIGLTFGYGGIVWNIIKINDGHKNKFNDIVITEDQNGMRCTWSKGGLEYFLKTYPGAVISG